MSKKNKKIIIGVAIAVVVLAFFYVLGDMAEKEEKATTVQATEKQQAKETQKKKVESGTYDIDGASFVFTDYVNDDTTGNWKLSKTADQVPVKKYALDYYKKIFNNDDEVHAVVNFTYKQTAAIKCLGNMLDVTVHEYVPKEEHSAKTLFGGRVIKEYQIDIKTGKIK